jgi:DNA polymerase/3'-5' exonuclease PolX
MDHKQSIIDFLEVLRKKEVAAKEPFKAKAYATVIRNIKSVEKPVNNIDDLKDVKGIGEKIRSKLIEYFETGAVKEAQNASNDHETEVMQELMNIHGIGPSKARALVDSDGVSGIDDLKEKLKVNPQLLNDKQKMGLKYYKDFMDRIPRKEMLVHNQLLEKVIKSVDDRFDFQVTGSFRRMAVSSGDIDVLITHKDDCPNVEELFKSIVDRFKSEGYICDVFAEGGKKCLAVCKLKRYKTFRRIDLLYTNKKEYPFAVLYFTGDAGFNVAMRQYCLGKGLSLSEHGLKDDKTGKFIEHDFEAEKDIFDFLGLAYVEPKDRSPNALVVIN